MIARSLLLIALCSAAFAQDPDRTHPPAPAALRPYKTPPLYEVTLPNGLAVILADDPRLPLATLRVGFRCGSRRDPADMPGVNAAVSELLTESTATRGTLQISEALEREGGTIGTSSTSDSLAITGSAEAGHLFSLIEIAADVARNAELKDIDLRLYRQKRRQSLARQYSQPAFLANLQFRKALFGDHPYARLAPPLGSPDKLTRRALLDYRDTWLVPNNAVLVIVGRLPARAEIMKAVADHFGSWERKPVPGTKPAPLPAPAAKMILADIPGAADASIRIGKRGASLHDPDYFAEVLALLAVPSVHFDALALDEAGVVAATAEAPNEKVADTLRTLMESLGETHTDALDNLKSMAAASLCTRIETQAGLADELMNQWIEGLPANSPAQWSARLQALTADELAAAEKKFLAAPGSVIVVAGDAAKLQQSLAKTGKFEIVKAVP